MERLVPLTVAIPFLAAALLLAISSFTERRRLIDLVTVAASGIVAFLCILLLIACRRETLVYWFGGWRPQQDVALGICFVVDPAGAIMAALSSVLVTLSLVFSWHYFDAVRTFFHSLMLIFLGSMVGFSLTGDLFNMFVFFELMGVAAYALTGYKIEETGPLQGGLNFLVMNSIGAFFVLAGIAVLYGRTGALNMAQIGQTLASRPMDAAAGAALGLLLIGFMVKAAIVPFHFWLPDAHAVAPAPVSVLLSGVMVEMGLFAIARIHGAIFFAAPGRPAGALRDLLLVIGALTALLGGIMCAGQCHLKRLLAFSTVSHAGFILSALMIPGAAAGAFMYMVGHGTVKATLFFCVGILLHRFNSVDEIALHGVACRLRGVAAIYFLAALGLTGTPLFATFIGKSMVEEAAPGHYGAWLAAIAMTSSILTGGAALRVGAGVFLGWGKPFFVAASAPSRGQEERETEEAWHRIPAVMWTPPALLVAMALAVGLLPGMAEEAEDAAQRLGHPKRFISAVLRGTPEPPVLKTDFTLTAKTWATGLVTTAGAALLAAVAVWFHLLAPGFRQFWNMLLMQPLQWLRRLHSGYVGDYVVWFMAGSGTVLAVLTLGVYFS